jgi:hypothetical protein
MVRLKYQPTAPSKTHGKLPVPVALERVRPTSDELSDIRSGGKVGKASLQFFC